MMADYTFSRGYRSIMKKLIIILFILFAGTAWAITLNNKIKNPTDKGIGFYKKNTVVDSGTVTFNGDSDVTFNGDTVTW